MAKLKMMSREFEVLSIISIKRKSQIQENQLSYTFRFLVFLTSLHPM